MCRNRIKLVIFIMIFVMTGYVIFFITTIKLLKSDNDGVLRVFDLTRPLDSTYESFICRRLSFIEKYNIPFCIQNQREYLNGDNLWQKDLILRYEDYLNINPDSLVIDIGIHVGVFTLYGAASGTKVLSVESDYDNQIRLHKASHTIHVQNRIVLITSKVNNHLDYLVPYLPLNKDNKPFKKAIMKIDLNGDDMVVFENVGKLFDAIQIEWVLMEWYKIKAISELLDFFYNRKYIAYDAKTNNVLDRESYSKWPFSVIWKIK